MTSIGKHKHYGIDISVDDEEWEKINCLDAPVKVLKYMLEIASIEKTGYGYPTLLKGIVLVDVIHEGQIGTKLALF